MTDQEINVAIAELCGCDQWMIQKNGYFYRPNACGYTSEVSVAWKLPHEEAKKYEMYADRDDIPGCEKVLLVKAPHPDYCNDLNAMHEAEKTLLAGDPNKIGEPAFSLRWLKYLTKLEQISGTFSLGHNTARQRAEAFLRVHGKWKEEDKA